MENKEVNQEQIKAEKFFERLWKISTAKVGSWILVGIFLFIIMILCMIPVQEFYSEAGDFSTLMPMVMVALTYLMESARVSPYNQYVENQKSRFMTDIVRYHPISKKAIWKLKTKATVLFLGKVATAGLIIQLIASFIVYQNIQWENFLHIFTCLFVIPVGGELLFDSIAKKVGE